MSNLAATWAPRILSLLRIVTGLLFLEHGMAKLFGFPPGGFTGGAPGGASGSLPPLILASALLEFGGGALITLGLFTRPVAFLLSGEMAVAYFMAHAPRGFFPILNQGEPAILYCFIFLYLSAAGAGIWSLDQILAGRRAAAPGVS